MHPITVKLRNTDKKTKPMKQLTPKFYMMNWIGVRDPFSSNTAFFFFFKYVLKVMQLGIKLIVCTEESHLIDNISINMQFN